MQVHEHDPQDSLGEPLFNAGVPEDQVGMWEHAERMMLLGDGLWDRFSELRDRFDGEVPDDVWEMIRRAEHEAGQYEAATLYLKTVADGEFDADDPDVPQTVEAGMEAARSFYAWRAVAIEVWTARLRAPI